MESPQAVVLEEYFAAFRENTVGQHQFFESPTGKHRIIYADWIANGRLYRPIEDKLLTNLVFLSPIRTLKRL